MKNVIRLSILLHLILLSACSSVDSLKPFDQEQAAILLKQNFIKKPANQMIAITLPDRRDWKKVSDSLLIPRDETESTWNERIQTEAVSFEDQREMTANAFANNALKKAGDNCKQIDPKILASTHQYSIYEYRGVGCKDINNHYVIGKVFNGEEAVYAITYTANTEIPASEAKRMSQSIKQTQLRFVTNHVARNNRAAILPGF